MAWGFKKLFYDVKQRDASIIRVHLKCYLGSHSKYYRYANGIYKLTPEQQERILNIFKRYGYTQGLEFDHYEDTPDLGI